MKLAEVRTKAIFLRLLLVINNKFIVFLFYHRFYREHMVITVIYGNAPVSMGIGTKCKTTVFVGSAGLEGKLIVLIKDGDIGIPQGLAIVIAYVHDDDFVHADSGFHPVSMGSKRE